MVQWLRLPSSEGSVGWIPGEEAEDPTCLVAKKNLEKISNIVTKTLKMVHIKKPLKNKGIKVMKDKYLYEKCSNSMLIKNIH